jgi:multiple sugar transport system permease protein
MPMEQARKSVLAERAPSEPVARKSWEEFVRTKLPFRYIILDPKSQSVFQQFLKKKYVDIVKLNDVYGASFSGFEQITCGAPTLPDSSQSRDFGEFIAKAVPSEYIKVQTPENGFREYLLGKYGTLAAINSKFGLNATSMEGIAPPKYADDSLYIVENAKTLRHRYFSRNYATVLDYVLLHGDAVWVTILFCGAAILTSITVNPLCAYALSRFNLSYSYQILLFLLATMAFPGEVVMIPNFLLLKELGLLNTFWALILPGMASGFSVFLLKGFFDSLPNELYESGTIDGASELRMFWSVTIPMSKPIFAVIALGAFTGAYGAFMYALLVCQNPKMWTLMVWLYSMQSNSMSIMMAALTLAALPTLLVFAFAQKVIMRGIIIPMDK